MKNKEIEELLNKIRNSIKTHKELNLDDDMLVVLEFDVIQWNLLLSYIEQLEKDNQCKYRNRCNDIYECSYAEYQEMCNKNMEMALKLEQLQNNRDKAIDYLEKSKLNQLDTHCKYLHINFSTDEIENIDELIDILKGDSDE